MLFLGFKNIITNMKIEIFISQRAISSFKLYKKDKRKLKKYKNLKDNSSFIISRSLKWRFKLKNHNLYCYF